MCEKYTANNLQRNCANDNRTLRYNRLIVQLPSPKKK